MKPERKNNNEKYVWYMEQSLVDEIEALVRGDKIDTGGCRIKAGTTHQILYSDEKICGLKRMSDQMIFI